MSAITIKELDAQLVPVRDKQGTLIFRTERGPLTLDDVEYMAAKSRTVVAPGVSVPTLDLWLSHAVPISDQWEQGLCYWYEATSPEEKARFDAGHALRGDRVNALKRVIDYDEAARRVK